MLNMSGCNGVFHTQIVFHLFMLQCCGHGPLKPLSWEVTFRDLQIIDVRVQQNSSIF